MGGSYEPLNTHGNGPDYFDSLYNLNFSFRSLLRSKKELKG